MHVLVSEQHFLLKVQFINKRLIKDGSRRHLPLDKLNHRVYDTGDRAQRQPEKVERLVVRCRMRSQRSIWLHEPQTTTNVLHEIVLYFNTDYLELSDQKFFAENKR